MIDESDIVTYKVILGRATWTLLHFIALKGPQEYTEEYKEKLLQFFDSLKHIYPCEECSQGMTGILTDLPPTVDNRHAFETWLCQFHNKVNNRLGKPLVPVDGWRKHWISHKDAPNISDVVKVKQCDDCNN